MIINYILAFCITIFSIIVIVGLGFQNTEWIKTNFPNLPYLSLFITALFLFIASFRFKSENAKSKIVAYSAALLYVITPFFPIFIMVVAILTPTGELNMGKTMSLIVMSLPVVTATILSFIVVFRLSTNSGGLPIIKNSEAI